MDDRLDPRFAAAVRTALLDEVRAAPSAPPLRAAPPASRRPRWQPVLALGIAAVTIVAIAIGFSVASRTRSSPPATAPLGGDCAEILTSHAASGLIGKPLTIRPAVSALDAPEALAVPAVHGLQCTWSGDGDVQDASGIVLTVLPVALRPKGTKAETGCDGENEGKDLQYFCNLDVVAGGRWITGQVTGLEGGTKARTEAEVASLRTTLEKLPKETTSTPLDTTGWWSRIGCTALAKEADLATVFGYSDLSTNDADGDMVTVAQGIALKRTLAVNCSAEAATDSDFPFFATIHAYGGAGRVVAELMEGPDVTRLKDVDGAKVYDVQDEAAQSSTLWIVAKGGALELAPSTGDAKKLLPAVAPLLKTLDAHVRK